jgi:hypothetical protein
MSARKSPYHAKGMDLEVSQLAEAVRRTLHLACPKEEKLEIKPLVGHHQGVTTHTTTCRFY